MQYSDFTEIEFPIDSDIIYVLLYVKGEERVPFYVGQSQRNIGRFGDYVRAGFKASTDFKVGEAVKYLKANGYKVIINYKNARDRLLEEKRLIETLTMNGHRLLNELSGYDYRIADENEERKRIYSHMDDLLENPFRQLNKGNTKAAVPSTTTGNERNLELLRLALGERHIKDEKQKKIYVTKAKQFRMWGNYIAAAVLNNSGKLNFTAKEIRDTLRILLGDIYNTPGAMESSLCTADMEIGSKYNMNYPFLKRLDNRKGRYTFMGFVKI